MRVATGIEILEIAAVIMGKPNRIHPTLIWDQDSVLLVDTGYPGQLALLRDATAQAGIPLDRLTSVIVTHHDIDHVGGLPAIMKELDHPVEVIASGGEKPFIQGEQRSPKLTDAVIAMAVAALPPGIPSERREAFRTALTHPPTAKVDRTVADGEELSDCGGITVIETPGHSPGHICLYHHSSKTLVAGDALRVVEGQLLGPDPQATPDLEQATLSLKKFAPYKINAVICYHGGLYGGDVNRRIAELALSTK